MQALLCVLVQFAGNQYFKQTVKTIAVKHVESEFLDVSEASSESEHVGNCTFYENFFFQLVN